MSGARRASLALLAGLTAGCYVPAPADPVSLAPGDEVQVILTTAGRVRQSESDDGVRGGDVRGSFVRLTPDSLTLATRLRGTINPGLAAPDIRRPVTLARDDIREVTVPRLSRGRTGLLLGAAAGVIIVVATDLFDIRGDGGDGPAPPGPDPGAPLVGR